ncbi:hypothetical protein OIU85_029267 [Salix viminalis]|uniref:Transmembrane protein n=1 Tax=Salix viminalis TaxID=40686 RepID=A0A9Q0T781_SALVM|nr:hypothetical protein OIU85_029267 [Salix viminalis]
MYRPIKGQEEEDDGNRNRSLKSNDGDGAGGARTVVDENKSFILPTHSKQQRLKQQQQQQRLVSLDVFRGLTVALLHQAFILFCSDLVLFSLCFVGRL